MKYALITVLFLTGCASVQTTYAPDGRQAFALNCSGLARGWDKCLQAAGQKCGAAGYDILDRSSEETGILSGNSASQNSASVSANPGYMTGNAYGSSSSNLFGSRSNERSMLVACKK